MLGVVGCECSQKYLVLVMGLLPRYVSRREAELSMSNAGFELDRTMSWYLLSILFLSLGDKPENSLRRL